MLETYEQTLAQDPSSMVFVEIARACVERGDNDRAIQLCQQGVTHHPNSVAGRVLWGKALINTGRAAEAMKQFDLAVSVDRDNPRAYNLIGEALLRKGLYRSALPVLRRAAMLQPYDDRLAAWLDQTKRALTGGTPPVLPENTVFDFEPSAPPRQEVQRELPRAEERPQKEIESQAEPVPLENSPTVVLNGLPEETPPPNNRRITEELPIVQAMSEPPDPFKVVAGSAIQPNALQSLTASPFAQENSLEAPPIVTAGVDDHALDGADEGYIPTQPEAAATNSSKGGLLDEIPDEPDEPPPPVAHGGAQNPEAAEAIAKAYERELRAKLEVNKQKKTFWQAHGLKLIATAAAVVLLGGLGGSFWVTRLKNKGETLDSAVAKGLSAINADTLEQYRLAIVSLEHAREMDEGNPEVMALLGYAHAVLFAEHGRAEAHRTAAVEAFGTAAVRDARPDLALVVEFLVANDASQAGARQQLVGSSLEKAAVQAQAGRLLLIDLKYDEALSRLKKATELDPRNTRALVSLGDYYLAFEDWDNMLEMLSSAQALSPYHPARVIGHAEARLELGKEVREALVDLESLPKSAQVPPALEGKYALMLGRALAANGKHKEALQTLEAGQLKDPAHALEFALALGNAQRMAGQMALAQKSFEDALKQAPKNESAKEGLGRVLLARSREKELLERIRPEKDARKVALLRGIAFFRLGEPKKAKSELVQTQVKGRFPAEAAVYLALSDAAEEGQSDKSIEALEKLAATIHRNKAIVQVALARMYMQKGALDKARTQLEEAVKDPQDYEGNALLGELLLKAGAAPEVAMEPLSRAVERNGSHAPSRHLLTQTLLAMGKVNEALKHIEIWAQDNPSSEMLWHDATMVYFQAGKLKEADQAMTKVGNSDDVEMLRTKASIFFARGDGRAAMGALERANKVDPKDPSTFCEIGNAFVRQGLGDTAVKAYEAAVREDPKSVCGIAGPFHARPVSKGKPLPRQVLSSLLSNTSHAWQKGFVQATLARVLLMGNDIKGAKENVETALSLAPGHAVVWYAVGEVAKKEKNDAKALEAYGKAAELDGSWSQARLAYADALAKQGGDSIPKAITQYEAVLVIDQNESDVSFVKKTVNALRKQLSK